MTISKKIKNLLVNQSKKSLWTVMQILAYLISSIPLKIFYSIKINKPENLKNLNRGTVIISNHQSYADPFLILACLSPIQFLKIIPVRFPVADDVYRDKKFNPRFFPILKMLGCFSIGNDPQQKMQALFYIRDLVENGETLLIFPEGKLNQDLKVTNFQQGVNFFRDSANSMMLVKLRGLNGFRKNKGEASITYSEIFIPPPQMNNEQMSKYLDNLP
jgi:1-acyl-sn-glycerol-3-phosphate acyltransferase